MILIAAGAALILFGGWRIRAYLSGDPGRYLWAIPQRPGESDVEYAQAKSALAKAEAELEGGAPGMSTALRAQADARIRTLRQVVEGTELHRGQDGMVIAGREIKLGGFALTSGLALLGYAVYQWLRPSGPSASG